LAGGCGYMTAYSDGDCREKSDFVRNLAKYGGYYGNDGKCFMTNLPTIIGF
jgi:leishmanolysin